MRLEPRVLQNRFVRLEPFGEAVRSEVKAALDVDAEAWSVMSATAMAEHFDPWWSMILDQTAAGRAQLWAVRRLSDGAVVGVSGYHDMDLAHDGLYVGYTFYRPEARGGAVNPACKRLLFGEAFDQGAMRVGLMIDAVNARSQAAVAKMGAVREGTLRAHKITWTGRVRDTVVLSVLADEWPAVRDGLDARLSAFG